MIFYLGGECLKWNSDALFLFYFFLNSLIFLVMLILNIRLTLDSCEKLAENIQDDLAVRESVLFKIIISYF